MNHDFCSVYFLWNLSLSSPCIATGKVSNYYGGNSKAIGPRQGQQSGNYQWTSRGSIVDKQTGSYMRATVKENHSTGDVFKERSTGRVGYKDETKSTCTFRAGDKHGYSEYQIEERYRRVDYRESNNTSGQKSRSTNAKYLQ